jgi:hypothetical protein
VEARFFAHVQNGPGAHPASCTMGAESIQGYETINKSVFFVEGKDFLNQQATVYFDWKESVFEVIF